jgi:hypothetical protein
MKNILSFNQVFAERLHPVPLVIAFGVILVVSIANELPRAESIYK